MLEAGWFAVGTPRLRFSRSSMGTRGLLVAVVAVFVVVIIVVAATVNDVVHARKFPGNLGARGYSA